jgi:hypothetical protein
MRCVSVIRRPLYGFKYRPAFFPNGLKGVFPIPSVKEGGIDRPFPPVYRAVTPIRIPRVGPSPRPRQAPERGFVVSGLCNGLTDDSDDGFPLPAPALISPCRGSIGLLVGFVVRLMVGGAAHLGGCTNPALSCHSRWRGIAPALTHLWTAIRETPKAFATAVCVPYFFNSWSGFMGLE